MACGHAAHGVGMRRFGVTGTCCRVGLVRRSMGGVFHQLGWPRLARIDQACYCADRAVRRFEVPSRRHFLEYPPLDLGWVGLRGVWRETGQLDLPAGGPDELICRPVPVAWCVVQKYDWPTVFLAQLLEKFHERLGARAPRGLYADPVSSKRPGQPDCLVGNPVHTPSRLLAWRHPYPGDVPRMAPAPSTAGTAHPCPDTPRIVLFTLSLNMSCSPAGAVLRGTGPGLEYERPRRRRVLRSARGLACLPVSLLFISSTVSRRHDAGPNPHLEGSLHIHPLSSWAPADSGSSSFQPASGQAFRPGRAIRTGHIPLPSLRLRQATRMSLALPGKGLLIMRQRALLPVPGRNLPPFGSLAPLRTGAREGVMRARDMCPDQNFSANGHGHLKIQMAN